MEEKELGASLWEPPSEIVAQEFFEFSARYPKEFFDAIDQRIKIDETVSYLDGPNVANLLDRCIAEETPASLVRLSDGEGNLLSLAKSFGAGKNLVTWCASRISYIHFGDHSVVPNARKFFIELIEETLASADVIGFAEAKSAVEAFSKDPANTDVRAVVGNRASLLFLNEQLERKTSINVASAWISRHLLPYYKTILQKAPRICIISTYEQLPERLASAFSIPQERFSFIGVPTQAVFIPTKERQDTKHFPNAMERILKDIKMLPPNTVVLVAAGLLGKKYCSVAKQNGCVAIDIGSIAEVWLGISARGMSPDFIEKWTL